MKRFSKNLSLLLIAVASCAVMSSCSTILTKTPIFNNDSPKEDQAVTTQIAPNNTIDSPTEFLDENA